MGLVGDHGEPAALQLARGVDQLDQGLERLDRDDHDLLAADQRLRELGGFGVAVGAGDGLHHALVALELGNRVLQLLIQHSAVGHDHDRVEHLLVSGIVELGELVGQPGDRVGLAGTRRVLDEVPLPGAVGLRVLDQPGDGAPLVVAGEQHLGVAGLLPGVMIDLGVNLGVHERAEDLQPGVALQNLFPEVGRRRAVRVQRVAPALIVAPVERQEPGLRPVEFGGHRDLGVRHREMHQRTAAMGEQRLTGGIAVEPVLLGGVRQGLREVRLQLHRGHRQPVDEQHQIQRPMRVLGRIVDLPHHPQPHPPVGLERGRVDRRSGPELRHPHPHRATGGRDVAEPATQDFQGAAVLEWVVVQRLRQPPQQERLRCLLLRCAVC